MDENLKFEKLEISDRNGFDKKTKITLLIGNGLWRSLSEKEFQKDKIGLDAIFKEFLENNETLNKFFSPDNFHEEDFGKLDVICEIFKQDKFKKIFKQSDMDKISIEKEKLLDFVVKRIREVCDEAKNTTTYNKLKNELSGLINNDEIFVDFVTLNYDQLIYPTIVDSKDLYSDGFKKEKNGRCIFNKEFCKWIRKKRNLYSHLHGSFLFREENDNTIEKIPVGSLNNDQRIPLIVLTGNNSKYQKIHHNSDENFILHVYNYHFVQSLCQSNILTILGYGFLDEYLNNDIKYAMAKNSKLEINIICSSNHDSNPKKFKSELPIGIKKERIILRHLEPICDVTSSQLLNGDQLPVAD